MIVVTGASGQLGRLVIDSLLARMPAGQIVAAVRNPERVADLAQLGVQIRQADYNQPDSLLRAFAGADKVLLISSSEVGQRVAQHAAVIAAARQAQVKLLAYIQLAACRSLPARSGGRTSTDRSLAAGFRIAGRAAAQWLVHRKYIEASILGALEHGVLLGSAGEGRIASAARAD